MRTVYGDGTVVTCDYGQPRLEINGEPYPLPVKFKKQQPMPVGACFVTTWSPVSDKKI